MFEGRQYTLECTVQNVAPVQNLIVTFSRGRTVLSVQSNDNHKEMKPVKQSFTLNINTSKEDDGVQYSCEAKLELEMPQPRPLVKSNPIISTVFCEYNHNATKSAHLISVGYHFALRSSDGRSILIFYLKRL